MSRRRRGVNPGIPLALIVASVAFTVGMVEGSVILLDISLCVVGILFVLIITENDEDE